MITVTKTKHSRISELDFAHLPFGKYFSDHMLIARYGNGQWHAPEIIPYGPLPFTPAMATLHYGQAVFEGMKAFKNADDKILLFRPEANYARMNASAKRMCMPEFPEYFFTEGLIQLVALDKEWIPNQAGASLYIRPVYFGTDEMVGVRPSDNYIFAIITSPSQAYYNKPLKVRVETLYSRASRSGTGYAKAAGNYGGAMYPTYLAQKDGFDQVLWTDAATNTLLEESGTMNVMFVIEGKLITPELTVSKLAGITRDSLLILAKEMGLTVEERAVRVDEVLHGLRKGTLTEAFGTGTAANVAEIRAIDVKGELFELQPANAESVQQKLSEALNAIKYGIKPDPYGWVKEISASLV